MKNRFLFTLFFSLILGVVKSPAQADCLAGTATEALDVNMVRTTLGPGGTLWPDGYAFPNIPSVDLNAIFIGGLWVGGFDPGGNLKLAAQTYGTGGQREYFPGPLDPLTGNTQFETCQNWDKVFPVTQAEIDHFLSDISDNGTLDESHPSILGWPGRGNASFSNVHAFELPDQSLAPFIDINSDGNYNPLEGDYPAIKGEKALWWVVNDAGGLHSASQSTPLKFEFQIMAFASADDDPAIDNTTFYELKIINRALESLDSTMISLWVDPDLGCYTDDYAGCLPEKNLAFVYNADAVDGNIGCSCEAGISTYCEEIPVLGIKVLKSPELPNGEESGITSFIAYNNASQGSFPPGTTDPNIAIEYYNLMSGSWRDGSPITTGGDGYDEAGDPTPYHFPDNPANPEGWSMCSANLNGSDIRLVISTGNISLAPGQVTQLAFAVTIVRPVEYPCPDIGPLIEATDIVENFYAAQLTSTEAWGKPGAEVALFPNPGKEIIQLNLLGESDELERLLLFDAQGKMLRNMDHLSGKQFLIHRHALSPGIYFYKVRTNQGKIAIGKLVFQ